MLKSIRFLIVIYIGRIDWTDFVSLRRPCAHRLNGDRDTFVSAFACCRTAFSLVRVRQHTTTKKSCHKGRICFTGRIDWTRTSDLFVPNEAFYQAELQSVCLPTRLLIPHFFILASKIFKKTYFSCHFFVFIYQ